MAPVDLAELFQICRDLGSNSLQYLRLDVYCLSCDFNTSSAVKQEMGKMPACCRGMNPNFTL